MHDSPFADAASAPCAGPADLLIALSAHFGRSTPDALRGQLDDDARRLFGMHGQPPVLQAQRLAAVMAEDLGLHAALSWDCPALLLDRVLATGRGHPAVLAAIGADLCRRAGVTAGVFSSPERWFVGLGDVGRTVLMDAGLPTGCPSAPRSIRGHCGHELAFCVLSGLMRSFRAAGQLAQACQACRLRLALPIDRDLRAAVWRELDELEPPADAR
jgi:hypothetical protein